MAKVTDKEFWKYVESGLGVLFKVRKLMMDDGIEISRQAIHDRCNKTKEAKAKLKSIREAIVDKAEHTMVALLDDKDKNIKKDAAKFVLDRLGKDSGYSKRLQISDPNDEPITIKVEIVE